MSKSTTAAAEVQKSSTKIFKGWSDFTKVLGVLTKDGPVETLRIVRHSLSNRLQYFLDRNFDKQNNTETDYVRLQDLAIASGNASFGVDYIPTSVLSFKRFMAYLPDDLRDFTFVDFGSGKGRALLIAARYPFAKVVGVEFSEQMVEIANQNIANQNREFRTCADVSSQFKDAAEFELPDEKLVLYFFDPFGTSVMQSVVDRIVASYRSNPRPILIVYHQPDERAVFDRCDVFREVKKKKRQFVTNFMCPYPFIVYEMTGGETAR